MESLADELRRAVAEAEADAVRIRRTLHQCPEPGLCERETAQVVEHELQRLGLPYRKGLAETGMVAELKTGRPGPDVALRADMDGLPVHEMTGVTYGSRHGGYSHACGHDGNMACVLSAARVLRGLAGRLGGRVRFIFQPAEELSVGAARMIQDGLWSDGAAGVVLALHAWPHLDAGTVGCRPGPMMASATEFSVTIRGRGGHAARPRSALNPLHAMARIIQALDAMNTDECVVTLSMARAGEKANVIADTGYLAGTIRVLEPERVGPTLDEVRRRVTEACRAVQMTAEPAFGETCPPVLNDPGLFETFRRVGGRLLGPAHTVTLDSASMGAEDFAHYLRHSRGLIFRLGMGPGCPELHCADFDFNDRALPAGTAMLAGMTLALSQGGDGL